MTADSAPSFRLLPVEPTEAMEAASKALAAAKPHLWSNGQGAAEKRVRDAVDRALNLLNAALAAAPVLAEATGWRPISSAPKDGTPMLLTNGLYIGVGHYKEPYHGEFAGEYQDQVWVDETDEFIEPPPTHCQLLPALPDPPALNASLAIAAGQ